MLTTTELLPPMQSGQETGNGTTPAENGSRDSRLETPTSQSEFVKNPCKSLQFTKLSHSPISSAASSSFLFVELIYFRLLTFKKSVFMQPILSYIHCLFSSHNSLSIPECWLPSVTTQLFFSYVGFSLSPLRRFPCPLEYIFVYNISFTISHLL